MSELKDEGQYSNVVDITSKNAGNSYKVLSDRLERMQGHIDRLERQVHSLDENNRALVASNMAIAEMARLVSTLAKGEFLGDGDGLEDPPLPLKLEEVRALSDQVVAAGHGTDWKAFQQALSEWR